MAETGRRGGRADRPTPRYGAALAIPILVALAGLGLYVVTLAPTVLWGDDAELQRIVQTGEARSIGQSSRASHLLWLWLARQLVPATAWLPLDAAGRANLVSAVAGALTLPFVYAVGGEIARPFTRRPALAGLAAAVALALSHTFWLLAVRPDVYTLEMALLAAATWCVCRWRRTGTRPLYLVAACGAVALALTNHVLILTSAGGLVVLAFAVPPRARRTLYVAAAVGGVVASAALGAAALRGVPVGDLAAAIAGYRPKLPPTRDTLLMPAYLAYQFPLSLPLAGWGLWRLWRSDRGAALGLAAMYAGNAALMLFRYHPAMYVRDQFIFFLPSYLPVALLVGAGFGTLLDRRLSSLAPFGRRLWAGVILSGAKDLPAPATREILRSAQDDQGPLSRHFYRTVVVAVAASAALVAPLLVYPLAGVAVGSIAVRLAPARPLPGRDPVVYYLLPPKTGYTGARVYGEGALAELAPDAAIVADWLPYQTLRYLQEVEGVRPDVLLEQINAGGGAQLRFLVEQQGARPLYLPDATTYPYYELPEIEACFTLTRLQYVYRLTPRTPVCR